MKNSTKTAMIAFILGLGVMFVADMIFHSNTALLENATET